MAQAFTDLITKVRYIINDIAKTVNQYEKYDSAATRPAVFLLDEDNVSTVSNVYKNGAEQDASTWTYSSSTGEVTLSFSCSNNDVIQIKMTAYEKYSDAEIQSYIYNAVYQLSVNNYKDFKVVSESVYPDPTDAEENLIAIIAGILINPDNKSYSLPNLNVRVADSKPTYKIIQEVINRFKKNYSNQIDIV